MRDLFAGLVELLLPACCAGCGGALPHVAARGAPQPALCRRCAAALPHVPRRHCTLCQQRPALPGAGRCGGCRVRRRPLDACLAGCWYEGDAAAWVRGFKFPGRVRGLAAPQRARLRALALETLARAPQAPPDAVGPVPLHPRRLRARGFSPALALARDLARARGLPLLPRLLCRIRDTPSQTGLPRRERLRNLRGAFRARSAVPPHVWLVDDVVTTGATLEAAARALRRGGARRVVALCAARTPPPRRD